MAWRDRATFAADCLALVAGLLIATPFVLVLTVPFLPGL